MRKILAILLMTGIALADGAFVSIQGESGRVTVTYNSANRDSTWVVFYAPASGTAYDSVKCTPIYASTRFLEGTGLALDSLGLHRFVAKGFASDAWADTIAGTWLNIGAITAEAGSGYLTYPCTLFVGHTSDSTAVAGVSVTIRPFGGGTPFVISSTDDNGLMPYSSEAESISVYLHKQGESVNAVDTLVIAGAQTDSLWATAFAPTPSPASMTSIFSWITEPAGDTIYPSYFTYQIVDSLGKDYLTSDLITFGDGSNKILLTIREVEVEADSSKAEFSLYANANLSESTSKYRFKAKYRKDGRAYMNTMIVIAVPDQDSFNPFSQ